MAKARESGKKQFIKGSLIYLWEELKTLNRRKLQALVKILKGFLRMKWQKHKKIIGVSRSTLDHHTMRTFDLHKD